MINEIFEFPVLALATVFGQDRHKGRGERTLGKQTAQEVGDLERDKERVRTGIGAKDLGKNQVANEAQDP